MKAFRKVKDDMDARNPPGIGFHDLLDRELHPPEVNREIARFYPHRRCHTGAQRGCHEVRWGKSLSFPLVVRRRICLNFSPGLQVPGNRSQISLVNNC
jgi:hypothetical protein